MQSVPIHTLLYVQMYFFSSYIDWQLPKSSYQGWGCSSGAEGQHDPQHLKKIYRLIKIKAGIIL